MSRITQTAPLMAATGAKIELNEADKEKFATQLLGKTFAWAREAQPSQPVTSGVWLGAYLTNPTALQRMQLEQSDIITFHNYDAPAELRQRIEGLKKLGRPVLCTEYMARGNHSTFMDNLPVLKQYGVAAWSWGLVNGKSNTIYPWDSWARCTPRNRTSGSTIFSGPTARRSPSPKCN